MSPNVKNKAEGNTQPTWVRRRAVESRYRRGTFAAAHPPLITPNQAAAAQPKGKTVKGKLLTARRTYVRAVPARLRRAIRYHNFKRWQRAGVAMVVLAVLVVSNIIWLMPASALFQGPQATTAGADNAGVGTSAWGTPGNITAQDTTYATNAIATTTSSHYIFATGFGFTVPTGSTITGVSAVVYENSATSTKGTVTDNSVMLLKAGATTGTSQATAATWPVSTAGSQSYGSSSNLWGATLAVTDVNASNFGVAISAKNNKIGGGATLTANIDYITMKVYYTPPATNASQNSYRLFNNSDASATATFINRPTGLNTDSITQTADGGYAVVGSVTGVSGAAIEKYDAAGHLIWSKVAGGSSNTDFNSIEQTADGGYVMGGTTPDFGAGSDDALLAKYDSSGNLSWLKTWGGTNNEFGYSAVQTTDGGYILTGDELSFGAGSDDVFLAKYDSNGTLSWNKVWGGTGIDRAYSVIQTSDGGYAVAGGTVSFGAGSGDAFLIKYDSSGNVTWNKTWGGTSGDCDLWCTVIQAADGGYVLAGDTLSFGAGSADAFLAKFDSSGNLSWSRTWGGTGGDCGSAGNLKCEVVQTTDGGYAIGGTEASFGFGSDDIFAAKFNSSGTYVWSRTFGTSLIETENDITSTSDGGVAITGIYDFASAKSPVFAKYDSSGNISGCSNANYCKTGGTDYTPTVKSDTVGGGSDYTSTVNSPTATTSSPSATASSGSPTIYTQDTDYTITSSNFVALNPTGIDVGTALAAQNTLATIPSSGVFRMRLDLAISNSQLDPAVGTAYKLQYAKQSGTCDTAFSGETYADVTTTTPIAYNDNTNAVNGLPLTTNANDPTDSARTLVRETYNEANTSTVTPITVVPTGQDAMFDFALKTGQTAYSGEHYCLRVVDSSGSVINAYTTVPEVIVPTTTLTQSASRFFAQPGSNIASANSYTFSKSWGGATLDSFGSGVDQTTDGGYIVTGNTKSFGAGVEDMFLNKYDATGTLTWNKTWGGTANDEGNVVVQTSDGGYVVTGITASFGAGSWDMFLAKYDSSGTLTWNKTWGGTGDDYGNDVVQTADGGYAVTGKTTSFGAGQWDMFLAKYDSSGTLTWNKTWGGSGTDEGSSLVQTADGGYAVAGDSVSFGANGGASMFLAKYDSSGTLTWSKTWGGISSSTTKSLIQTTDGGYVITGQQTVGASQMFIVKYDSSGTVSWDKFFGDLSGSYIDASSVVQTGDNGYVVAGGLSIGSYLAKYDSSGVLLWSKKNVGQSPTLSLARSLALTSDGGFVYTGNHSTGSNWVMGISKYDSVGDMVGCGAASACVDITPSINYSPAAYVTSPTATVGAPTATVGAPTATVGAPTATVATLVSAVAVADTSDAQTAVNGVYAPQKSKPFRVQIALADGSSSMAASGFSLKLQFATRGSDNLCDTSFTGETYADVTSSTAVQYFNDTRYTNGGAIAWTTNNLLDGTNVMLGQQFVNANNFSNTGAVLLGQDGYWDFSLQIASTVTPGTVFCLRVINSAGTNLASYTAIPEIQYGPTNSSRLRGGKFFDSKGLLHGLFLP